MMKTTARKTPTPSSTGKADKAGKGKADREISATLWPEPLNRLQADHLRFRELVAVIERKSRLEGFLRAGDYYLLRDILAYLHDYPLHIHHPVENRLCELLLEKRPSTGKTLMPMVNDHGQLEGETRTLLKLLDRAIDGPNGELEAEIRTCCATYAANQLAHMDREEQKLFPLARKLLTGIDWANIEQDLMADQDPLFGAIIDNRFRLLHEFLIETPDEDYEKRARSLIFSTERAMQAVTVVGGGFRACRGQIRAFGSTVRREARNALSQLRNPDGTDSRLLLPARFTGTIGKSLASHCREVLGIATATARDTLELHRAQKH